MSKPLHRIAKGLGALLVVLPAAAFAAAPNCGPVKILPNGSLPQAPKGDPYTAQLSATLAGNPIVTPSFTVTHGALPPSLTLSTSGAFGGSADNTGNTNFRVTVVDTLTGCTGSREYVLHVINVNHAPSFTGGADQSVFEDAGAQSVPNWATAISDGDGGTQTLSFQVLSNDNPGLFSAGPAVDASGTLTYTPAADKNGVAHLSIALTDDGGTANGGMDTSAPAALTITVGAVNDAPSFTKGADQTTFENASAQTVSGWATAITAGPADESGQALNFNVTGNTNPSLFSAGPAVAADGTLTYTPAAGQTGTATITLTLSDDGGTANGGVDTSAAQTFDITVSPINHVPSFTKGADQTVLEDAGAQTVAGWATAISQGAGDTGQTLNFQINGNTNAALFSVAPAVDATTGTLTYTPAANANGTATITLALHDDGGTANGGVDTSANQSFVITVTAVNDAPSFTKGPDQSVLENAGAQTVNPWATAIAAGPADESGQALSFNVTNNSNPSLFAVAPSVSPTGVLTYTPATNAFGSATITLTLSDNGGTANGGVDTSAAQTFTITVSNVNQAPSFTKGPDQTVLEDAGPQTVNPWATGISPGAGEGSQTVNFQVTGNTNAALFSAAPAVSPSGVLTYTPAPNANGTATITLTLHDDGGTANGGVDTSAPQSFVITVTAVNDVPSFTKGPDQTVLENAGPQTVNPWATAISAGPPDESGQSLTFNVTGNTNPSLFATAPSVSPTGVLTYTPATNTFGSATITLTLSDNGGTANGGVDTSAAQTFTITVDNVNQAPSFTKGPDQTVNEDAGPQTANPWATGISPGPGEGSQTVAFQIVGNTNPALFSAGPAVSPSGVLTYTSAPDANGSATITLQLQDNGGTANGGSDTSAPQSFVITVNAVNDAPSFTKGPDQTVLEDAGPQTVNPWATGISPGPSDESGQTVSFVIVGNTNPGLFSAAPAVSSTGVLTYTPAPNANGGAMITLHAVDSAGGTSADQSFSIAVTAVNDAPSFTKGPDQTGALDDSGPQTVNPWATGLSAGPANESGQTLSFVITGNTDPSAFSAGPSVSSTGVLTYTPAAQGTAGSKTSTITLHVQDNGGTANGGVDVSADQSFVITITHHNLPPALTNNPVSYATLGNTQLHVAGATLPGVFKITDAQSLTAKAAPTDTDGPSPVSVVAASGTTANGGSYVVNANGSFTYVPAASYSGTDSFTYQVTDGQDSTTGTVNVTVDAKRVWYIRDVLDADNASGGDGRSTNAFDTIAQFNAATTNNGDYIFVFAGNTAATPHSGKITLKDGQKLYGEGYGLNVPGYGTLIAAGIKPKLTNTGSDTVSVPATAGNRQNIEIRGMDLSTSTVSGGNAVDVTSSGANAVGVVVDGNTISGTTVEGLDFNAGGTGAFAATVSNNTVTATGNGIDARTSAASAVTLDVSNNSVTSNATGILVDGSGGGTVTITGFANNAISGNNGGTGIAVTSAKFDQTPGGGYQTVSGGTTVIGASGNGVGASGLVFTSVSGDLSFTDLDVFADNGAAVKIGGTGTVNLGAGTGTRVAVSAGAAVFQSVGGPALDLSNLTASVPPNSITSSNSSTTGVNLDGIAGTVSAGSGSSITGSSGTAFRVNASNASVTYDGTITSTTGKGVDLTTNTGSTITFTGTLSLSSGTNTAFNATGGGTVSASNTNSTLTSTTGTALNVAATTIGASGLKFKSVSAGTAASGPANGIVLNNTGSSGSLDVGGSLASGAPGAGGTIQRTTGDAISLTKTLAPSFNRMLVQNITQNGVNGTQVNGFTFQNGTIDNVGTAASNFLSAIAFNGSPATAANITGTLTVKNNTLSNAYYSGLDVQCGAGTLANADVSNNTVTSSTSPASSKGYGINFVGLGSAGGTFAITKATIDGNTITNFPSGGGIQVNMSNSGSAGTGAIAGSSGANQISITNNLISATAANKMNTSAIIFALSGGSSGTRGTANFTISGNGTPGQPLTNMLGTAILIGNNGYATMTGAVTSNVIVANNTVGSNGIGGGNGIVSGLEQPDLTLTVSNNNISATDGNGILLVGRGTNGGIARFKVQNNTVAAPLAGFREGIRIDAGNATVGSDDDVCLNISGNTTAGTNNGGTISPGIGLRKQGTSTTVHAFGINGLSPSPTGTPTVENYVNSLNPGSASGTFGVGGTDLISATSGFTSCTLP